MMNDSYENNNTLSSRFPEPPYRKGSQGDTSDKSLKAQDAEKKSGAQASTQAQTTSGTKTPGKKASTAQNTTAGVSASQKTSTPNVEPHYEVRNATVQTAQAPASKSSGHGKTFLFGFLGALVACALVFGGYSLMGTNKSTGVSTTTLGSTDSTVINAVEEGKTLAEAVAAKALPSVVAIYNYQKISASGYGLGFGASMDTTSSLNDLAADTKGMQAAGMGSGVVISDDGYIITNYHVVENADQLTVKVGDDERDATYVGGDESSDIAVIKIEDTQDLQTADIGDSDNLKIGEWVMTVGAPLGLEQSVATGVISATNRSTIMNDSDSNDISQLLGSSSQDYTYYPNMIQTDAVINPGNSGGALVDSDGKLIGINAMISSYSGDYAGVGFAIPVNYAMGIAEQVISGKKPTHAILGVSISSVDPSNAQRYGLSSSSGAYISAITEGTGAAKSELQVGDIIVNIDDSQIASTTDVTLEVRKHNPGDKVVVTVDRNGETKEITVELSSDENQKSSQGDDSSKNNKKNNSDDSNGSGNSSREEQLEELLKMFGM